MVSTRSSRNNSSVLGKRAASDIDDCQDTQVPTPDPSPLNAKRPRTRSANPTSEDSSNKENIPPLRVAAVNEEQLSARTRRLARRASVDSVSTTSSSSSAPRMRRSVTLASVAATPTSVARLNIQTPPATPESPEDPNSSISAAAALSTPPTAPIALLPIEAQARGLLRSTCNAGVYDVAGRASERAIILNFIDSFIRPANPSASTSKASKAARKASSMAASSPTALFISGSPGTGKTALMNDILNELATRMVQEEEEGIKIVNINCISLGKLEAVWERVALELSGVSDSAAPSRPASPTKSKNKARDAVEEAILDLEKKCILVLDELDYLSTTSTPAALSSLFAMSKSLSSHLRIIGIANTHTLLSSTSAGHAKLEGTGEVLTVHFKPYEPEQLLSILHARLAPLSAREDGDDLAAGQMKKFLPPTTLLLLSKKVGALTGDVRALFEVLRGAIDHAAAAAKKTSTSDGANPMNVAPLVVSPPHVLAALKTYKPSSSSSASKAVASAASASAPFKKPAAASETVTKVSNLSLQARLVLSTLLLASKRLSTGLGLSGTRPTIGLPSPSKSPSKKANNPRPSSPIKGRTVAPTTPTTPQRTASAPAVLSSAPSSIDSTALHTFYATLLSTSTSLSAVSRPDFADILGLLETLGLIRLSSASSADSASVPSTPRKGAFKRTASFGAGKLSLGCSGQDVSLVGSLRIDEVLRGLGVSKHQEVTLNQSSEPLEEEVRFLWAREAGKIRKELMQRAEEEGRAAEMMGIDVFDESSLD